jgi:pilus assembly protein TadC
VLVAAVVAACLLPLPRARALPGVVRSAPAAVRVPEPDAVVVLDLLAVAVEAGASVPRALGSVGGVLGGTVGEDLRRAGEALVLGAPWLAAWSHAPALAAVLDPLAAAWAGGTAAGPALRTAAAEHRRGRERAAEEAAARLGVRLVLPLGLCFLPAFVLIGLVPVLVSLAGSLLG